MSNSSKHSVIISGAGPTGLALGCVLADRGVECLVVDRAPRAAESRALGVQARTLELLERLDMAEPLVAEGRRIVRASFYSGQTRLATLPLDEIPSRYNFLLSLPQSETERLLEERLAALGGKVERGVELLAVEPASEEVRVRLKAGGEREETAEWLVGCDGADSTVRHQLDIPFPGDSFPQAFFLADVRIDSLPLDDGLHAFITRDGPFAVIPLPEDDHYRLILAHRDGGGDSMSWEDWQDAMLERGGIEAPIERMIWSSRFHIHRRLAERFRQGRVLLAGDAAHIHSPVGGQGMNLGIQDAFDLGERLAQVVRGEQPADSLDQYAAARRAVARKILKRTTRATNAVLAQSWWAIFLRDQLIRLAAWTPPVRKSLLRQLAMLDA